MAGNVPAPDSLHNETGMEAPMEPERDIDTAPGGLTVWRSLFGGSVLWGRFKLFAFIAAFLLIGGLVVAFAPL
jgi:hypothetical protein